MTAEIAIIVRCVAVVVVVGVMAVTLFASGFVTVSPERSSRMRRHEVDWVCPRCEAWGTVYVSRLWRERARRRAIGLLHRRVAPSCAATDRELVIVA